MGRRYTQALLESMVSNQKEETVNGVRVLVKPIPEGGADGDMDPRVHKSMQKINMLMKLMPKKKNESPEERVASMRKMFADYKGEYIANEGIHTDNVTVASADGYKVPVRVYTRTEQGNGRPVFVYYHGGGFFGGSLDIVEQMCKLLVQKLDCVAVNIGYRLGPENHYPAPFDDCFFATQWAHDNAQQYGGDSNKLVVSGDSAGGNLAAAVTLRDREQATGMVKGQVLLYPAVNIAGHHTEFYHGVDKTKYHRSPKHAKVIDFTLNMMGDDTGNMLDQVYLQGNLPPEHIYASPLLDDMHSLPPTLLVFGEHDFLVFEDFAYAQTLTKAGVTLKTIVYRGMGHGFADQIGVAPQAEDCIQEIAAFITEQL